MDPQRRKLLGWLVGVLNVGVLAAIFGPVLGFIGSPLAGKKQDKWVSVLDADQLAEGQTREVTFVVQVKDGYMIAPRKYTVYLRRFPDKIVAFDPACTHLGCRVKFQSDKLRYFCPCHGGVFDDAGQVVSGPPPEGLKQRAVKVVDGRIYVQRTA